MSRTLSVEGALQLESPHGDLELQARSDTLEVRVARLSSVPFLFRRFRGAVGPLTPLLRRSDLRIRIGWRRWLPLEMQPSLDAESARGWHVRVRPWRVGRCG